MLKATKLLLTIIFIYASAFHVLGQSANYSGTWNLNFEKSKLEHIPSGLTGSIYIIKHDGAKFSLTRYHIYDGKRKKIHLKMYSDSETRRVKILFHGKLEQQVNSLLATFWGKNFRYIVNCKFGNTENELVAYETFTGKPQNHRNIWVFDKEVSK